MLHGGAHDGCFVSNVCTFTSLPKLGLCILFFDV